VYDRRDVIAGRAIGDSMSEHRLTLSVLPEEMAVCRLAVNADIPQWALGSPFCSITRTADELSVVVCEGVVPDGVQTERGWRALEVAGPLHFSMTGVLASLAAPLAEAGISIFALSTFKTDYVLVKKENLERAIETLRRSGHTIRG
jgi:hypothetical protein